MIVKIFKVICLALLYNKKNDKGSVIFCGLLSQLKSKKQLHLEIESLMSNLAITNFRLNV